jgi:mannose-6-phosphate isomerase-like protein (cupin superfamily)
VATVIPLDSLSFSPTAKLFEGGEHGLDASFFVTEYERDQGVGLHKHPYAEVFLVETGVGLFTVGDEELFVEAGTVLIVPAETQHGFRGAGDDVLRVVSVHPRGKVEQAFL